MTIILKIAEMMQLLDKPTVYIAVFTLCWFVVLTAFVLMKKLHNKVICAIVAAAPVVHFIVFFILNFTVGAPMKAITRHGVYLIASLIFCLVALGLPRRKKNVLKLVLSGISAILVTAFSITAILVDGMAMHYGNFSQPGYGESMAALITEVEQNYVLRDHKEIDFDELRKVYIPLAEEAEKNHDEEAFAEVVANFCYEFHDGHFYIRITDYDLRERVNNRMSGNDYGFSMLRLDDGSVIAILADENTEASKQGIHNGTVITAWDGVAINEAIESVRCVRSAIPFHSYPIEANEDLIRPIYLAGQGGDTVDVTFIDDSGNEKTVTVPKIGCYYDRLLAAITPLVDKRCEEFGYATMLDDHVGYICIPCEEYDKLLDVTASLNDDYPAVRELITSRIEGLKAQGMTSLVIDLRDNDGGLDVINEEVATLFTKEEIQIRAGIPDGNKAFAVSDYWIWTVKANGCYADTPVVALVNCGCASSGDVLAHHLSECNNVTLMGYTTTWGSAQCMGGECLLSGGHIEVRYPIMATLYMNGDVFVDAGKDRVSTIPLDVKIPLDRTAVSVMYEDGQDYELAYACAYLNGQIAV